jgi:hypothetical protein
MRFVFGAVGHSGHVRLRLIVFQWSRPLQRQADILFSNAQHNRKHVISWIVTYLFVGVKIYTVYIIIIYYIYIYCYCIHVKFRGVMTSLDISFLAFCGGHIFTQSATAKHGCWGNGWETIHWGICLVNQWWLVFFGGNDVWLPSGKLT